MRIPLWEILARSKKGALVEEKQFDLSIFRIMVGGGPVRRIFANEIGADGYGYDAVEAVAEAKRLLLS